VASDIIKQCGIQQRRNKYAFSLFLKHDSDEANLTSLGRLLHSLAPATGKAPPPTVNRLKNSASICPVDAHLSLCQGC